MRQTVTGLAHRAAIARPRALVDGAGVLSRGLAPGANIRLRLRWPLALFALALAAQLLMPDPVWSTAAILLGLLYVGGWLWLRLAASGLAVTRRQSGALLVVGDTLEEEFYLSNGSSVPLAWLEVQDASTLPGYAPGRVVSVGAHGSQRWRATALCTQRGRFRMGPHRLATADPFSLFELSVEMSGATEVLIYPRALRLPALPLARGESGGETRARRPYFGTQPGAAVREWRAQDDLRFVHWPSTARLASLMVRELELEPAGDVWLVVDSNTAGHGPVPKGPGAAPTLPANTFEFAISVAAGVAVALHGASSGRAAGLLVASGAQPQMVMVTPRRGAGQVWALMAALAPLEMSGLAPAGLLQQARGLLPSRSTLLVLTADLWSPEAVEGWMGALVGLRERGMNASALLLTTPATAGAGQTAHELLTRHGVGATLLPAEVHLPAALTQRRRRTIVRSSPLGRAVTVEVEEEVG